MYLSEAMLYHDTKLEQASLDILAEKIEEVSRRILINLPPQSFERIVTRSVSGELRPDFFQPTHIHKVQNSGAGVKNLVTYFSSTVRYF